MELKTAEYIFEQIKSSRLNNLADKLISTGIRYARLRVDWLLISPIERINLESERTIAHNAFISSCDILARNMEKTGEDNNWRKMLGNNRKDIGDFACWLHFIIGIKAR